MRLARVMFLAAGCSLRVLEWRQAFLTRNADDRKRVEKQPRIPTADQFFNEQIEQRRTKDVQSGKTVSEWRIKPDKSE